MKTYPIRRPQANSCGPYAEKVLADLWRNGLLPADTQIEADGRWLNLGEWLEKQPLTVTSGAELEKTDAEEEEDDPASITKEINLGCSATGMEFLAVLITVACSVLFIMPLFTGREVLPHPAITITLTACAIYWLVRYLVTRSKK